MLAGSNHGDSTGERPVGGSLYALVLTYIFSEQSGLSQVLERVTGNWLRSLCPSPVCSEVPDNRHECSVFVE